MLYAQIDDLAEAANTVAIKNLKFSLFERRRNLVLDDFDARLIADDLVAFLDGADTANIETN